MPNIYDAINQFNLDLSARESQQFAEMTKRWAQMEGRLSSYIQQHADAIATRRDAGLAVGETALTRLETWNRLEAQIVAESAQYQRYAQQVISAEQQIYGETGIAAAQSAIRAEVGAGVAFGRLNPQAVNNMVGIAGDGSPLFDVLKKRAIAPDAVAGLQDALIEAVTLGYSPRKTAKMMADGLAQGLTKALTIARTEQIRAYRTSSLMQYQESGIVTKYQRHAAPSERTCLACIALDGKIYDVNEFASHPNCRCFMTPVIDGVNNPARSTQSWLERQNDATQKKILGGHYDAYKNGTPLADMVKIVDDKTWGATIKIVPLKELTK